MAGKEIPTGPRLQKPARERLVVPGPNASSSELYPFLEKHYPRYLWAERMRIPPESLAHPTVRFVVDIQRRLDDVRYAGFKANDEAHKQAGTTSDPYRPNWAPEDPLHSDAATVRVAQAGFLRSGLGESFPGQERLHTWLEPAVARVGISIDSSIPHPLGGQLHRDKRTDPMQPHVEKGSIWRTASEPPDEAHEYGAAAGDARYRRYTRAALHEAPEEPLSPDHLTAITEAEATRLGLPEGLPAADRVLHYWMLELAYARAVVAATAPDVVATLPEAPGLFPSVPDRLDMTHELGQMHVALLESKFGKEIDSRRVANNLMRILRPYGLDVLLDPEGKPPKRFLHWRE